MSLYLQESNTDTFDSEALSPIHLTGHGLLDVSPSLGTITSMYQKGERVINEPSFHTLTTDVSLICPESSKSHVLRMNPVNNLLGP